MSAAMGRVQWIHVCHRARYRKTQERRGKHSRKGQRNSWILADAGDGKQQTSFEEIAWVQRQYIPHSPFLHRLWQVSCNNLWNGSFLGSLCHRTRRKNVCTRRPSALPLCRPLTICDLESTASFSKCVIKCFCYLMDFSLHNIMYVQ